MKALLVVVAFMVALSAALPAAAQTPTIGVFFDQYLTRMDKDCPPDGGLDSLYVVASGFDAFVSAVEYAIEYPASMTWVSDYDVPPVTLGTTPTGITEAWALPKNGYSPFIAAKVMFMWNCSGCLVDNQPVDVVPHPVSGFVRATDFPNYNMIDAIGMRSLVCATVPAEETTWGQIKSLYGE